MNSHTQDQDSPDPDAALVVVMETAEAALLPLVQMALEQAGIDYFVRNTGISDQIIGSRATATVGNTTLPFDVLVRAEDESRARELLIDLESGSAQRPVPATAPVAPPAPAPSASLTGGVDLFDAESGSLIGRITPAAFDALAAHLERESTDDKDYYVDDATLTMLEEAGVDGGVIRLLRGALGARSGMEVRWAKR